MVPQVTRMQPAQGTLRPRMMGRRVPTVQETRQMMRGRTQGIQLMKARALLTPPTRKAGRQLERVIDQASIL